MPSLERHDNVYVLTLGDGENRFNADSVGAIEGCLDEVVAQAPCALVTAATGKFWSNGLDLEWIATQGDEAPRFVERVHAMLARFLELGVYSVAAIQGHAFAAGAMLALAHDERLMRTDRGFFCLPEVDIRIPFSDGMSALIAGRLPAPLAHELMTTGRRYGGVDAAAAGVVTAAHPESELLRRAIEQAAALSDKDPATLAAIKQGLHRPILDALRAPLSGAAEPAT